MLLMPYTFKRKENILFTKIPQVISRSTGPNTGLFVFILMQFSMLTPKISKIFNNFEIFDKFSEKKKENVVSIRYLHGKR